MKKMMLAFMLILLFQATTATAEASLTLWSLKEILFALAVMGKWAFKT